MNSTILVNLLVSFSSPTLLSLVCLWYLPIPEPQKGRVVEEYQHWLHIKLMDSLPNSYSIFLPSGLPSVSSPLPLLNFFNSFTPTQLSSVLASPPTLSPPLSSPVPFSRSLAAIYPPLQNLTLPLSLCLCLFFFLTSSSVVWLTEKCLICSAFLLDSSWSKMSATPPGATGTWYSTIVKCWSCVLGNNAQGEG